MEGFEGFLLYNERFQPLTGQHFWGKKPDAGWVWTEKEVNQILRKAKREKWKKMPMYYQYAWWDANEDNVYPTSEVGEL